MIEMIGDDPTKAQIEKTFKEQISVRLSQGKRANPPENYLVIMLFACHGVLHEGNQSIVLNEYDKSKGFYKLLPVEKKLRTWANIFPNAYFIGIFACCRTLWDNDEMCGLISKADKEVFEQDANFARFHMKKFEN